LELYTDASIKDGVASIGIWHPSAEAARSIGSAAFWTPLYAEMEAITQAAIITLPEHPVIIYTDCKYAIETLNDKRRTDTTSARLRFRDKAKGKSIKVCWVPGHAGVRGNERAHTLASGPQRTRDGTYPVPLRAPMRLLRAARRKDAKDKVTRRVANITNSRVGKFTKELDSAFDSGHTRRLYDGLTPPQSSALSQLRTGINKLNGYLYKIHCSDTPTCDCDCNLTETIQHFLFTCPRWVKQRRALRTAHGETWGNLSLALGGGHGAVLRDG